ncbi:MAG: hypothetical protein ACREJO_19305 [Phycisphaerales bacterium]
MSGELIVRRFGAIGARVAIGELPGDRVRLNIDRDRHGEFFVLQAGAAADVRVVDARPDLRHLLLMAVRPRLDRRPGPGMRDKFLCGHDERHWFVAAVPDVQGIGDVRRAMEALKPEAVRRGQAREGVRWDERLRRKTAAYVRQGEWFFLPRPEFDAGSLYVHRDEPLSRGLGSKPHRVDECVRTGGQTVYVSPMAPRGLEVDAYRKLLASSERARKHKWEVRRRDAMVLVRGRVRHPDHATVRLGFWHEVMMNTEWQAPAMRHVAFLD